MRRAVVSDILPKIGQSLSSTATFPSARTTSIISGSTFLQNGHW